MPLSASSQISLSRGPPWTESLSYILREQECRGGHCARSPPVGGADGSGATHCHRAGPALSGGQSFGGSPQCLHPSHHQNHARQAEPPSHCANDHPRSRRGPYTLRESSQLLRGPQPPRRSNTPHCAAKHTIPVNACGQREVLTVVTHPTPTTML